jgi:MSHA biogenesis protein MshP
MSRARSVARARGFALVPALFLIVVVGLLSAVAVRLALGQSETVALGLAQARALAAARAGIELGAYRALNGTCGPTSLSLGEGSLAGFTVQVTCIAVMFTEDTSNRQAYALAATAVWGSYGQPGYVRRVVRASFSDAP